MYFDKNEVQKWTILKLVQNINRDGKRFGYSVKLETDDEGCYDLHVKDTQAKDSSDASLCFVHISDVVYWAECHNLEVNTNGAIKIA